MGCTSSKPKRTKSIEDVHKGAEVAKQTNGGVATADRSTEVKSFLAPDDIPFIDEEVEEQRAAVENKVQAAVEIAKDTATTAIKDASNIVSQRASDIAQGASSVVQDAITAVTNEASKVANTDASITVFHEDPASQVGGVAEKAKEVVEGVISQVSDQAQDIVKVEDSQTAGEDDLARAATKIQAMYRGYQSRKNTEPLMKLQQ